MTLRRYVWSLALSGLLTFVIEAVAEPCRVESRDGKIYEGEVTRQADGVVIDRNGVRLTLKNSDIVRITPLTSPRDEYGKRVAGLKADDANGHFNLALWCKEMELWDLAKRECTTVLALDPKHPLARQLLTVAERSLSEKPAPAAPQAKVPRPVAQSQPIFRDLISAEDIQRLRFAEIVLPNPDKSDVKPDQVPVLFTGDVLRRFWEEMQGAEGFQSTEDRRKFLTMKAIDQLGVMVRKTGNKYQPNVQIKNDPRVFNTFKTRLWPILNTGCAASNCHSGPNAAGFRLHTGPARTAEQVYTNFLILNSITCADGRLINRDRVEESLLLHYGLSEKETKKPHPGKITPIFRNSSDPKYRMFEDWIYTLVREPNYGVKVPGTEKEPEQAQAAPKPQ